MLRQFAVLLGLFLSLSPAWAADWAVVLMYHRFGENAFPSTSIDLEQFQAHLKELKEGPYYVLPLPKIIEAIETKQNLPDRTVAITIDDAYLSVYNEAWPRLKAAGFPFTLFVSTSDHDRVSREHMTWAQIKEMAEAGVTIGSQTSTHPHMPIIPPEACQEEMETSNAKFEKELGKKPELFAYPYGEASDSVKECVKEAGYKIAFGQHSGVIYPEIDKMYMPRFAFNQAYGDIKRFKNAVNALPLRAIDLIPADATLNSASNPPSIGFTLVGDSDTGRPVSCFASHVEGLKTETLGPRVELRLNKPFPPGRSRINCTLYAGDGRFRWFGYQYYLPK